MGQDALGRGLVATTSSTRPPADETEVRWRRRPVLATLIRAVVTLTPLVAAVAAGVAASRLFRPTGWAQTAGWIVWTGVVSFVVLGVVDVVARRLLPLQRLLQLCLVFPDRAPSRLRIAVAAARPRRPESLVHETKTASGAAEAAGHIVRLLAALAMHDRRTRGHSERVCAFTELVADQMQLSQADRDRLMWVALIHDIGKLQVPSRLLNKPGRPTVPEWHVLQAHPERGDEIAAPLRPWLGPWADAVLQHHERYDGGGYPHGLSGDEITLGARIIAVTDAFEVMTAPRPYRRPVDAQSARSELARHAGGQFDPDVVRHFLAIGLPQLRKSMGWLAWLGQVPFIRTWPRLHASSTLTATQAASVTAAATSAGLMLFGATGDLPGAVAQAEPGAPVTHFTATPPSATGGLSPSPAPTRAAASPYPADSSEAGERSSGARGSQTGNASASSSGSFTGGAQVQRTAMAAPAAAEPTAASDNCTPHPGRHGRGQARGWTDNHASEEGRQHRHDRSTGSCDQP